MQEKIIWIIGHYTHAFSELIARLTSFQIELVADIRSFSGSKRYPHFSKELLEILLPLNELEYVHLKELGVR